MYKLEFSKQAIKELRSFDKKIAQNLLAKMQKLALNPYSTELDVKKLKACQGLYRLRVGGYRIIYEIQDSKLIITIIKIGTRGGIYAELR